MGWARLGSAGLGSSAAAGSAAAAERLFPGREGGRTCAAFQSLSCVCAASSCSLGAGGAHRRGAVRTWGQPPGSRRSMRYCARCRGTTCQQGAALPPTWCTGTRACLRRAQQAFLVPSRSPPRSSHTGAHSGRSCLRGGWGVGWGGRVMQGLMAAEVVCAGGARGWEQEGRGELVEGVGQGLVWCEKLLRKMRAQVGACSAENNAASRPLMPTPLTHPPASAYLPAPGAPPAPPETSPPTSAGYRVAQGACRVVSCRVVSCRHVVCAAPVPQADLQVQHGALPASQRDSAEAEAEPRIADPRELTLCVALTRDASTAARCGARWPKCR
jgi:hypothetical protein